MSKPILLTHPDCLHHEMAKHAERPDRLRAVLEHFDSTGLSGDMQMDLASEITEGDIEKVHPRDYIEHVGSSEPVSGTIMLDPDTYMSPGSYRASKLAAGAAVEATQRVLSGETNRALRHSPPWTPCRVSLSARFLHVQQRRSGCETALKSKHR